jgi:type II secretory pathway component PulK
MSNDAGEQGFAVPFAVGALAILSLICSLLLLEARELKRSTTTALVLTKARLAADGAIYRTIFALISPQDALRVPLDGSPVELRVGQIVVTVRVTAESAKIDINRAPQNVLASLFQSSGALTPQAQALAQRADAWRRKDGEGQAEEIAAYSTAERGYAPRFAPFRAAEEINLVLGVSADMSARIDGTTTVWSRDGFVDRSLAPTPVLEALAAGDDSLAEAELGARRSGGARPSPRSASPGEVVTVEANVAGEAAAITRRALVALRWDKTRPFDVLSLR